jgi:thiol-disulfide isomerase/thioredoxin
MPRAIFLLLILLTHSIVAGSRAEGKASADRPPAPQFTLKDARGRIVRLKDYIGKIVVINFWATWRPPCLAEVPEFARLQRGYRISCLDSGEN